MSSMYGMNNMMKVDLQDGKVKFVLSTTGVAYDSMQEAFEQAGKSGMTTFARLTGVTRTSSESLRGLGGFSQRLIQMQESLSADRGLATRLGVTDPSKLFFEVGSFKMPMGQKETTRSIIDQLNSGIVIPDDGAFNLIRVFEGTAGKNPVELSVEQISRLFTATSGGAGGLLATGELQAALAGGDLSSLFQKVGKRVKGIVALRGVSLAGDELSAALSGLNTNEIGLNEKTVRVFKPGEELRKVAERYLSDPTKKDEGYLLGAFDDAGDLISKELKDFYAGTGAVEGVIERLNNLGITKIEDFNDEIKANAFKGATEASYDGTSVINSSVTRSMKSSIEKQLKQLEKDMASGIVDDQSLTRFRELTSQLESLKSGDLEATTGRVFMTIDGQARNIKAVFDSAGFRTSLQKYGILTTDVAIKKETALMGQVDSINLVLQGQPSPLVYQDPLMPAFHYGMYDESFEEAQKARTAKVLSEYRAAVETGEISKNLKSRIYKDAGMDITGLPEVVRNQQSRNKMFAQRLKQAIESGADIRTMPQLLNYLKSHTESRLYRLKDGMYQPALEDAFRFAIDTEQSYYAGREIPNRARLGAGLEDIKLADGRIIKAAKFQVQGHKMLFGGDAASIFKASLGGFDLDDHGIVMPRIFQDASGDRLGTFIFRQPTGPAEFVFGKADFGNSDTVKAFLSENDAFGNAIDDLIADSSVSQQKKSVYMLLKQALDPESKVGIDARLAEFNDLNRGTTSQAGALEQSIMDVMGRAERYGYKKQSINIENLFRGKESGAAAAGVSFSKQSFENLLASGFAGSKMDEKFMVDQYNEGAIRRAFVEKGSFGIDNEFIASIKGAVGESIYNSQLKGLEATGGRYLSQLGQLMNNASLTENIQVAIETNYLAKARAATKNADSIGVYINRLTVASAGSDQMQAILEALQGKGVSGSIIDQITKKYIAAVAPSDVVDLIVNLNGTQGVGLDRSAEVMRAFYEGSTDKVAAEQALAKVMNIKNIKDTSAVDALGIQMIETKGELMGQLRSLAMRNLDEAQRTQLMAGMDTEFIRQRLSGTDISGFISSMVKGYESSYADIRSGGKFVAGTDQAIIDDYNSLTSLSRGTVEQQRENLTKFMGLGADSNYAPLSKAARIGRQAKEAMEAESARVGARRTTSFASEINMTADAQQLSENILKSYLELLQDNRGTLENATGASEEVSELFKSQKAATMMQINDKVYSMIYKAAEMNEGVTVGQLADNMEFMMNSRYPRLRSLMTAQMFGEGENDIMNMFYGAQSQRRLRDADRQGRRLDLVDQYNSMIDDIKANKATQKEVLDQMISNHERFKRISITSTLNDDSLMAAAAIFQFDERKDFSILGLTAENEKMVRDMLADAEARRFIEDSEIDELLSFGRGSDPTRFAPPGMDRVLGDEDLRAISLGEGIGDDLGVVNPSSYRRITDSWKSGKLGEAFGNPVVKKSSYALIGLIAASLLYSGAKDRSEDDMSGPPLLPGGSSYEQMTQRQSNVPDVSMFSSYSQGTSYSVNIEGSQDQIDSFSSVAGANGRSTMYKGIPQLGRDPYPTLAGSV